MPKPTKTKRRPSAIAHRPSSIAATVAGISRRRWRLADVTDLDLPTSSIQINRNRIIETIDNTIATLGDSYSERGLVRDHSVIAEILALLRAREIILSDLAGWIPVMVLPPAYETVLALADDAPSLAFHDGKNWCHADGVKAGYLVTARITHWLQIPEPPKS